MVNDQSFCDKYEDGVPVLKNDHPNGYYTQIQMTTGLSQIKAELTWNGFFSEGTA